MIQWCLLLAALAEVHHPTLDVGATCRLIEVESGGDPLAISHAGAWGLGQLTGPAVLDALVECGHLPWDPVTLDLWDPIVNLTLTMCYVRRIERTATTWCEVLATYNGGYRQLFRLREGLPLAPETLNYLKIQGCKQ